MFMKIIITVALASLCRLSLPDVRAISPGGSKNTVFLGGSCNPTTWRKDIAIPELEKRHISYFNPQVDDWSPDLVEKEKKAKDKARVLLFVIDEQTRNIVSMIELAELSVTRPDALFAVFSSYEKGQKIDNEVITEKDYNELTNGVDLTRKFLNDRSIKTFVGIPEAIEKFSKIVGTSSVNSSLRAPFNRYGKNPKGVVSKDLYIGAVGNDLTWLQGTGEALIKSSKLSYYYNPKLEKYTIATIAEQLKYMENSQVIVLIIPKSERGLSHMIVAAYLIGLRAKMVLCIQDLPKDVVISGEKLTPSAIKDYNRGRPYLKDMAKKAGVPVFENPEDAVKKAIDLTKSTS